MLSSQRSRAVSGMVGVRVARLCYIIAWSFAACSCVRTHRPNNFMFSLLPQCIHTYIQMDIAENGVYNGRWLRQNNCRSVRNIMLSCSIQMTRVDCIRIAPVQSASLDVDEAFLDFARTIIWQAFILKLIFFVFVLK